MRDPFSWSFPLGRLFGITVRVHVLFPFFALALILRVAFDSKSAPGTWVATATLMGLLFVCVLLHEFGHCFAARLVEGDAHEILMWPLGGLASIEVPHAPRANFIAAAGGPFVNLLLCLICGLALMSHALEPPWNPLDWNNAYRPVLYNWSEQAWQSALAWPDVLCARLFFLNWFLLLLNLLPGFPLDGGRMFQAIMWWRTDYRQATLSAVFAGFIVMIIITLFALVLNEVMPLLLAWFVWQTCRQQWIILETGGDDQALGYDFSQGYTSLERDPPVSPRHRQPNFFQRWRQKRAARKQQQEQETREAEERRMDELLEKVQRYGLQALTDEERRFLTRVSARYRNRN